MLVEKVKPDPRPFQVLKEVVSARTTATGSGDLVVSGVFYVLQHGFLDKLRISFRDLFIITVTTTSV